VSAGRLLAFSLASLAIIVVPGPSVLFIVARGIAWGRAVALLTDLGNALGLLVLAVAVALGLGPLLTRSAGVTEALEVAGGAYLWWLGIDALRHRHAHAAALREQGTRPPPWRALRQGFVVGIANPKAVVFFVAVFPHFVNPAAGRVTLQLLVLGVVFTALAAISDGLWGIGAGAARDRLLASPHVLVGLRTAGGLVMLGLGTLIVVSALA
jgi:threonine/homoserine/homoserine lactone efflux protein